MSEPIPAVDDADLARMLELANLPALLCALVHATGDPRLLSRFATRLPGFKGDEGQGIPDEHARGIRSLALDLLRELGAAPPSPVDVTVTSSSGAIATLSTNGTLAGGTSVTFTNVTTTSVGSVFVQGRSLGSATLTGTAAGYTDGNTSVTVQPSGFIINSPNNFTTTTSAANTNVRISPARLNPTTLNFAAYQPMRGGASVDVSITSSDPTTGVITISPLTFEGNVGAIDTQFDPLAAGSSTIEVVPPPGFSTPSSDRTITATVNP